jgi:hypothetical protein
MKAMVSRTVAFFAILSILALVPASAQAEEGSGGKRLFTKHFQETLFDITQNAAYSTEILLNEKEYKIGQNVIGIVVHNAEDKDTKGATITLSYKNLDTNTNAPDKPVITDKQNGLYIVSGLDLKKEGRWELSITVAKDGDKDQVVFILPDALKELHPKGKYSP